MSKYPLISKVILIQVLISLIGISIILISGLTLLKSISNQNIAQYKMTISHTIAPNLESFISWYILKMPILNDEFEKLKTEHKIKSVRIEPASIALKKKYGTNFLVLPDLNNTLEKSADYYLIAEIDNEIFSLQGIPAFWYIAFFSMIIASILIILFFYRSIKNQLFTALKHIDETIEYIRLGSIPSFSYQTENNEFSRFIVGMKALYNSTKEIERSKLFFDITRQVSHDIRSPLSALNMTVNGMSETLTEEKKAVIKSSIERINDIANDLLWRSKQPLYSEKPDHTTSKNLNHEPILSTISSIVTEKKIQFEQNRNVEIILRKPSCEEIYSKICAASLKRIISNIVNNSFEAIQSSPKGTISISITVKDEIEISVVDNGNGIPEEILHQLGKHEITSKKQNSIEGGSGIGLLNAKKLINSWNGRLIIQSNLNLGTEVKIIIPISKREAKKLETSIKSQSDNADIVLIDDDLISHMTWNIAAKGSGKKLLAIADPHEFWSYLGNIKQSTPVYIDSNLGNNLKGEVFAKSIYERGFKNIFLTTGFDPTEFSHLNYLKGVIGKTPPNFNEQYMASENL